MIEHGGNLFLEIRRKQIKMADKDITGEYVLDLPCKRNDKQTTIREYLRSLLIELWRERECFSAKRPFGDWDYELLRGLEAAGLIEAEYEDAIFVDFSDEFRHRGHIFIDRAIRAL